MLPFLLPTENNKNPNFEWRRGGRGVDSFVLCSYPICTSQQTKLSLVIKTDDVTSSKRDVDLHGQLRAAQGRMD